MEENVLSISASIVLADHYTLLCKIITLFQGGKYLFYLSHLQFKQRWLFSKWLLCFKSLLSPFTAKIVYVWEVLNITVNFIK